MGLIKAFTSSVSSTLGDQFKEFITCPEISSNTLVVRGKVEHGKGNKNPSENIISNGSKVAVPEGMAMMIVESGKILEFTAEAGEFVIDTSSEPSIFAGNLGKNILDSIKLMGTRTAFGGQTARDQRVYFINLLPLLGNKFGSPQPKKITDDKYGILEVTFYGNYSIKVTDPSVLIKQVLGSNLEDELTYDSIFTEQLKSKVVEQITRAITEVMRKHKVPFGDIGMHGTDIAEELNNCMDATWSTQYGINIDDVSIADINLTDESMSRVSKIDDATIFSDAKLQSGLMASASAEAMKAAASNEAGSMMGFMGMGMANTAGTSMLGAVNQNVQNTQNTQPVQNTQATEAAVNFCSNCGAKAEGNFCTNCGTKVK